MSHTSDHRHSESSTRKDLPRHRHPVERIVVSREGRNGSVYLPLLYPQEPGTFHCCLPYLLSINKLMDNILQQPSSGRLWHNNSQGVLHVDSCRVLTMNVHLPLRPSCKAQGSYSVVFVGNVVNPQPQTRNPSTARHNVLQNIRTLVPGLELLWGP